MNILTVLIIILLILSLGSYPGWPHAQNWGAIPFGGLVSLVLILIILRLSGVL